MHSLHSFARDGMHIMHIDPGVEEQTQEQALIEEPEDPEPYPQQEDLQQAADSAPDDTDPSEEGMEFLFCACGLVIIRSKKRVELANEVTSVGMMLLYSCKSFGCHEL
ncbi:hypothetical protein U9M48_021259 [Paspalum notatum var. saurae]|uniref:Uncharacterized protein n=1 Tax=Paspalum notatum var. saurae TaxID=547442 RepID=A0AAQ3WTE6_PASNO